MAHNLLSSAWKNLDSYELRLLLEARIGGPGQYDDESSGPSRLHLPLAREQCQVALTYQERKIVRVEAGPAFDADRWAQIVDEIATSVLTGPTKVGREFSFSSYRVAGCWRGHRSGVQILPAPDDAPRAEVESAEHPFILEFPVQVSGLCAITNHRRQREHRRLTQLLNVLLAGRTNTQSTRSAHFWGHFTNGDGTTDIRWAQNFYFASLGEAVQDELTPQPVEHLEEIHGDQYSTEVRGLDGLGLRLPADLDEAICRYMKLGTKHREQFDRAAYWLDMARRQWDISVSASFAARVSAIESLINRRGPGSTKRFHECLERYAPGASLADRRKRMYDLRSGILHGSELISLDEDVAFGWDPPWWDEHQLLAELTELTRLAIRNWLRDPTP